MARIIDAAWGADGRFYTIGDDGVIRFRDSDVGHEFNHMPVSKRPPYVVRDLPDRPPSPPVKIIPGPHGQLLVLAADGALYERVSDRSLYVASYSWKETT